VLPFYFVCNKPLCCYFFAFLFPYVFFSIPFLYLILYVSQTFMRNVPHASHTSFLFTLVSLVFFFYIIFLLQFMISFFIPLCFFFYFISFSRSYNFYIYTPLCIKRELPEFTSLTVNISGSCQLVSHFFDSWLYEWSHKQSECCRLCGCEHRAIDAL
jgi:hypothetical protein